MNISDLRIFRVSGLDLLTNTESEYSKLQLKHVGSLKLLKLL